MLYHLLYPLREYWSVLNVFKYITFRASYAAITALLICFVFGPWLIRKLGEWKLGQTVREDGPATPLVKAGTPTMGGLLIVAAIVVPTLLWANLSNHCIWLMLFTTLSLGAVGFLDDYLHVVRHRRKGLQGRWKLVGQFSVGAAVGLVLVLVKPFGTHPITATAVPFLKNVMVDFGIFYIPFVAFVITAMSNAVNLSDGLDGLAIGLVIPPAIALGGLAYLSGNAVFANYLNVHFLPESGELTVYAAALVGAALGFLWHNAYPAKVFMGDTGSLALGGSLGALAVLVKREFLLVIVGGIFVAENLSVMIQVLSFKYRGKRVFKMAPLHHHFEGLGWPETRVVVRFWIIGILLALLTLSTIKLQ
jgi:phospho-N-acetylmuramoyl-pentapeptide-transferase